MFIFTRGSSLRGARLSGLIIGLPVGLLVLWFMYRLGTGAQVTVTDTQIIREISRPDFVRTTYNITQVDGGILASHVDYGRFRAVGAELILFVSDGRFLWIADGISRADVRQIAGALSSQGLMECLTPIGSTALTRVMGTINRERNRG